jgi:protoporphyrin/coproporphyrin ferrochelatase
VTTSRPGVLIMTYGSPASLERADVRDYLMRVRNGREPDDDLVGEFTRRYQLIGGSPLIGITADQARVIADVLGWPVEIGMRFSEPSIETGLRSLAGEGVTEVAAIVLSPQYSPFLMGGYGRAIAAAREALGVSAPTVSVAGAWHEEPAFLDALANRVVGAVSDMAPDERARTHVLMTAHSLPRRVAEVEPQYLAQLRVTARAIASRALLRASQWSFCWQSAGHEPGEWMKPDFADLMPRIAASGGASVVVVPVQFLADHLETLYDVDIGAREQAERHGLRFQRIRSLNAHRGLAEAIARTAEQTIGTPRLAPSAA